ncbi:general stress protein [Bhargavaea ullalensis]|uniref:Membrane protein n=2 Tax=Bhargavaea TaxID=941338 RepID=A0ABV2GAW3_9BACL
MAERRVVGYYDTEQQAIDAIEDLKRQGYRSEDISVISQNNDQVDAIADETGTKAAEGAATGAATGGVLGGLGGVLAGLGALAIPGIGPIVAAGPIVAGLTGAAAGAGVGGLAGALIGMGVPEDEAERYETYFNEGKILVLVDRSADVEDSYFASRRPLTNDVNDMARDRETLDRDRFNDPLI